MFVPAYWPEGVLKAFTATISAMTAILLISRLPQALKYHGLQKTPDEIKLNQDLNTRNTWLLLADYSIENCLIRFTGLLKMPASGGSTRQPAPFLAIPGRSC